jgi:hypothetical protein
MCWIADRSAVFVVAENKVKFAPSPFLALYHFLLILLVSNLLRGFLVSTTGNVLRLGDFTLESFV